MSIQTQQRVAPERPGEPPGGDAAGRPGESNIWAGLEQPKEASAWAGIERAREPLAYKRARAVLLLVGVLWLWLLARGPWPLFRLLSTPVQTVLLVYALAVLIIVSLFAAMVSARVVVPFLVSTGWYCAVYDRLHRAVVPYWKRIVMMSRGAAARLVPLSRCLRGSAVVPLRDIAASGMWLSRRATALMLPFACAIGAAGRRVVELAGSAGSRSVAAMRLLTSRTIGHVLKRTGR